MMQRWNQHSSKGALSKGGRWHFPNAIRLYGKDAFSHEVLEVCDSLEVANLAEECWIELFDTRNPEKGFNLAKGGEHIPHPFRNPWDRPDYRERRSVKSREFWEDPDFRRRVTASRARTIRTEESIKKRSEVSSSLWVDEGFRTKVSSSIRSRWSDPCYRERVVSSSRAARLNNPLRSDRITALRSAGIVSFTCSIHGALPLDECHVLKPKGKNPLPRIACRFCDRNRQRRTELP